MKDALKWAVLGGVFAVPCVVLIVTNDLFFPFITGKNFAFRILVELTFALWAALALLDRAYRPKWSWLLGSFAALIAVMALANAFGLSPEKSFWSNFERMEGWVTLVHLFAYVVVLGSVVTTERLWLWFFGVTLAVAGFEVLAALRQYGQVSGEGVWRVSGTFGNSTYLAAYLLFHIGIAALVALRTRFALVRWGMLALIVVFAGLIVQTGTRGAVLGLAAGGFVALAYVALFGPRASVARRFAALGALSIIALAGLFMLVRDTDFVRNDERLARIASISLDAGATRLTIWGMAFEGFKERPILGWGQENYNYVFNKYYEPSLYGQEPWFDRVHNIFLDWLVAGGALGFLAYFAVFGSALYYVALRPRLRKRGAEFTTYEQAAILGLFAAYLVHNTFVFDNLGSYIFYAVMLAFIHSRVATPIGPVDSLKLEPAVIRGVVLPAALVLAAVIVYVVNVPGLRAALELTAGIRERDAAGLVPFETRLAVFEAAFERGALGRQEVREQTARTAQSIARDPEFEKKLAALEPDLGGAALEERAAEVRMQFVELAERGMREEIEAHPLDARPLYLLAGLYRNVGREEEALATLERARELAPRRQFILHDMAVIALQEGRFEDAAAIAKEALDFAPENNTALNYYAVALIYGGREDEVSALLTTERQKSSFARNDLVLTAYYNAGMKDKAAELLAERVALRPNDLQARASLAGILHELGRSDEAVAVLRQAIADFPSFKVQGEAFIKEIGL